MAFFIEVEINNNSKIHRTTERPKQPQCLRNENKPGGITLPEFKLLNKAYQSKQNGTGIKTEP